MSNDTTIRLHFLRMNRLWGLDVYETWMNLELPRFFYPLFVFFSPRGFGRRI